MARCTTMSKTGNTNPTSAWDEPATSRQKDRIRAYGWEVPRNCTKRRASGMINAAEKKGLHVSKEYAKKITAYRKAQEEEDRKEEEKMRREYERDQAQDEAEFRKMFKPESKGCLLAFLVPFASAGGILAAVYLI